jgi:high-affinity iron transporter
MSQIFVLTLRHGLEAFVVVAVIQAYLERIARPDLLRALRWATAASLPLSIAAAYAISHASNAALWEGMLTTAAAACALKLTASVRWSAGVFMVTTLMITRAGAAIAALLSAAIFQVRSPAVALAGCAGVLCAAMLVSALMLCARRVRHEHFSGALRVFQIVFVAQMAVYGFHELTEANLFPYSEPLHWATEPYGPEGRYGQYLSALLVVAPLAYLAVASARAWSPRPTAGTLVTKSSGSVPNIVDGPRRPL